MSGGGGAINCAGGRGLPRESVLPIISALWLLSDEPLLLSSAPSDDDDAFLPPGSPIGWRFKTQI